MPQRWRTTQCLEDVRGGDFEAVAKLDGGQGFSAEEFIEDAPAGFVGDGGEEVLPDEQFTS